MFATARGTPYGHRNVSRRCLGRAAQLAGLNDDGWPPLRFHDLRHTYASHLIIDLGRRQMNPIMALSYPRRGRPCAKAALPRRVHDETVQGYGAVPLWRPRPDAAW